MDGRTDGRTVYDSSSFSLFVSFLYEGEKTEQCCPWAFHCEFWLTPARFDSREMKFKTNLKVYQQLAVLASDKNDQLERQIEPDSYGGMKIARCIRLPQLFQRSGRHAGRAADAHVHPFIHSSGACHQADFKAQFGAAVVTGRQQIITHRYVGFMLLCLGRWTISIPRKLEGTTRTRLLLDDGVKCPVPRRQSSQSRKESIRALHAASDPTFPSGTLIFSPEADVDFYLRPRS